MLKLSSESELRVSKSVTLQLKKLLDTNSLFLLTKKIPIVFFFGKALLQDLSLNRLLQQLNQSLLFSSNDVGLKKSIMGWALVEIPVFACFNNMDIAFMFHFYF